jgi:hypothetical protein
MSAAMKESKKINSISVVSWSFSMGTDEKCRDKTNSTFDGSDED